MGNLGFSADICRSTYLKVDETQSFACQDGKIQKLNTFGVIPSTSEGKTYCGDSASFKDTADCDAYIDRTAFRQNFEEACMNKENCQTTISFRSYVGGSAPQQCKDDTALFYV